MALNRSMTEHTEALDVIAPRGRKKPSTRPGDIEVLPMMQIRVSDQATDLMRTLLEREVAGEVSDRTVQMILARLLPPLQQTKLPEQAYLPEIPDPVTVGDYHKAMSIIWRATTLGRVSPLVGKRMQEMCRARWRAALECVDNDGRLIMP